MIEARRAGGRARSTADGLDSRHSFSYGRHYDPDNLGLGVLMAHNEDRLDPGRGYDWHPHRGVDIVTWVLGGTLEHAHAPLVPPTPGQAPTYPAHHGRAQPGRGDGTVSMRLGAGCVQVLRTGTGVRHAEQAAPDDGAHYVQMWLAAGDPEGPPAYEWRDLSGTSDLLRAGLVTVACGPDSATAACGGQQLIAPVALTQPAARLAVWRGAAGDEQPFPAAALAHVFVARGDIVLTDRTAAQCAPDAAPARAPAARCLDLAEGDAARVRDEPALTMKAVTAGEVLVWLLER